MTDKKEYGFTFYEDTISNDWYGIYTVDIDEVSTEILISAYNDIKQELNKRGIK